MISSGHTVASASATAVLPTAVGPTTTGTLPTPKPALQLLARQLHDGGTAVHVVGRQVGGEQPQQQLPHFALVERVARFYRGAAGVGRREPFQPVGPATEPPPSEIGHYLSE